MSDQSSIADSTRNRLDVIHIDASRTRVTGAELHEAIETCTAIVRAWPNADRVTRHRAIDFYPAGKTSTHRITVTILESPEVQP